jgi:hypothetical protein
MEFQASPTKFIYTDSSMEYLGSSTEYLKGNSQDIFELLFCFLIESS